MRKFHILEGHVLDKLREMPADSVHCVITSPPYWGLRDYKLEPMVWGGLSECEHEWGAEVLRGGPAGGQGVNGQLADRSIKQARGRSSDSLGCFCHCSAWRGSLGLEPTPELFIEHMVEVFREVRRVLRPDGVCFLNLGDSYAGGGCGARDSERWPKQSRNDHMVTHGKKGHGAKPKDLFMIPARVSIALQQDGWWLRSEIVWNKPNPMPESVTDRPTKSHEMVYLLTKAERYFWDQEAVREPASPDTHARYARGRSDNHKWADDGPGNQTIAKSFEHMRQPGIGPKSTEPGHGIKSNTSFHAATADVIGSRNIRSVWTIPTAPFPEAHFATFPTALVEPMVKAGTSERGCCPGCGAPWVRVVERQSVKPKDYEGKWAEADKQASSRRMLANVRARREAGNDHDNPFPTPTTTGWKPTCNCYEDRYRTDFPKPRNTRKRKQRDAWVGRWERVLRKPGRPDWLTVDAIVLDTFLGSGTTGVVALNLGRRFQGIELNRDYCKMAEERLYQADAPLLNVSGA